MFGGLAGSFWWVMLAYTVFQFLVFELASDRARRAVRGPPREPKGTLTHRLTAIFLRR
jgi:hypothetical protein